MPDVHADMAEAMSLTAQRCSSVDLRLYTCKIQKTATALAFTAYQNTLANLRSLRGLRLLAVSKNPHS